MKRTGDFVLDFLNLPPTDQQALLEEFMPKGATTWTQDRMDVIRNALIEARDTAGLNRLRAATSKKTGRRYPFLIQEEP